MLSNRKSFISVLLIMVSLAISTCQPVYAADFAPVFKQTILPHEGGFTKDKNDPGNWTGGVVGKGKLLGTNRGIAANTYGEELLRKGRTIKGLSEVECAVFYKRDFWDAGCLDKIASQGIADELMDEMVNMGPGGERNLLTKQFKEIEWATGKAIAVPRTLSCKTVDFINEYTKDRHNRIAFYNGIRIKRVKFYVNLAKKKPRMRPYILSWADRATD